MLTALFLFLRVMILSMDVSIPNCVEEIEQSFGRGIWKVHATQKIEMYILR